MITIKRTLLIMYNLVACMAFLVACSEGGLSVNEKQKSESVDAATRFKGDSLNLLTWEGYADKNIVEGFEKQYGVQVNYTYFGTTDELIAKLRAGGGSIYDIISPSGDVADLLKLML
ncbi:hypothetical protein [Peribacillus sp. TH14]|uniref:hypothetical protein n=1 Tax=Peribacillus sp. TH14 TaxID=2798481 RepID=UPI001913922D|nr:hypothetical protein [Peribacillus sp. TH14]MBK5501385.1 hypothetical protein [Peribacillus sp. TH14]